MTQEAPKKKQYRAAHTLFLHGVRYRQNAFLPELTLKKNKALLDQLLLAHSVYVYVPRKPKAVEVKPEEKQ